MLSLTPKKCTWIQLLKDLAYSLRRNFGPRRSAEQIMKDDGSDIRVASEDSCHRRKYWKLSRDWKSCRKGSRF